MPRKTPALERVLSEREKLTDAYIRCFNSPEGQVVLADLKATYHDRSSIVGVHTTLVFDVNRFLALEGCRQVYLRIVGMIEEGERGRAARNSGDDGDDIFDAATGPGSVFDT